MSASRTALLEILRRQARPTSLGALTALTGLHRNTVREHLDGLIELGLVTRERAPIRGRGRPAWLYAATPGPEPTGNSGYAGLASALATVIERTSQAPAEDAAAAGAEWGRTLAEETGPPQGEDDLARRRQVVKVFERMGFGPEADEQAVEVRLRRCPLLEAAYRHRDVVCSVHRGIVQGAMQFYGGDGDSELHPFSEPGACMLRLLGAGDDADRPPPGDPQAPPQIVE